MAISPPGCVAQRSEPLRWPSGSMRRRRNSCAMSSFNASSVSGKPPVRADPYPPTSPSRGTKNFIPIDFPKSLGEIGEGPNSRKRESASYRALGWKGGGLLSGPTDRIRSVGTQLGLAGSGRHSTPNRTPAYDLIGRRDPSVNGRSNRGSVHRASWSRVWFLRHISAVGRSFRCLFEVFRCPFKTRGSSGTQGGCREWCCVRLPADRR